MNAWITVAGALAPLSIGSSSAVAAEAHRATARIDAAGQTIVREISTDALRTPAGPQPAGTGIIWHLVDAVSITESVAMSDTTDESWVGHDLNTERLGYHQTTGTNVPIYEYDVLGVEQVVTASAEDVSLGVLMTAGTLGVNVRAFSDTGGNTPLWTYNFPEEYLSCPNRAADVSADGSVVAALGYDSGGGNSLLVILDGSNGGLLDSVTIAAFTQAIELSADGSRALLTQGNTAVVYETAGLGTLFSFAVSGGGGYHRLSRNGMVAAAGGFNLLAYEDTGAGWSQIWNQSVASNWLGNGIALSETGDRMFVAHYNYVTGYVHLTYRVIDLANGVELAQTSTIGSGTLQDTVAGAEASADGETFACISWGTQDNVHPEVQVFDADLNLIGSVDTPGSPFSMDMTRDGVYVLVGSKSIHANFSGNGSNTYTYQVVPVAACPWDCADPADGNVATADLLALLSQWGAPGPCDFDGGGVTTADLLKLLSEWGACP